MPRWLLRALRRIRRLAAGGHVAFTLKARRELSSLEVELDEEDARDVLANLRVQDSAGRLFSAATGEWMYAFRPRLGRMVHYVKVLVGMNCVVVSFHEDDGGYDEEEG